MSPAPRNSVVPRVVIVDSDRRVQASLTDLLALSGRVEVIGASGDVRSAFELVERERPDAVLVDARLPDIDAGEAFISGLQRAWPAIRIVRTGWSDVEGHCVTPRCAYVSKDATPEEFTAAIADACC